jgi:hypothetical protein
MKKDFENGDRPKKRGQAPRNRTDLEKEDRPGERG